jgi:hypothetical protein
MKVKIPCRLFIAAALGMALCGGGQQAWAALATTTTTLAVTSGGSPVTSVTSGSVVTLTATVTAGSSAVKTGRVNFCDATATYCTDIHLLGTAQLTSAGTAALEFVPGVGSHSYKAVFVGTNSASASSSSASALSVTGKYPTTATIAQSGSAGNYTLTATVAGYANETGLASPTGTVSFLDTSNGNSVLGTAALGTGASALGWLNSQTPQAGGNPASVAVGDFNGDGILDLAVADSGATPTYQHYVTILLGNGDGTFTPAAETPYTGGYPSSIAAADFNGDGILDLAVADYVFDTLTILLGNGDGTFTPTVVSPATGNGPDSVAVGDFNGDGIPDLAVSNDYSNTVTILLGNGDGTFTATAVSPVTGNVPTSVAVGDFNGDGKADLAVANYEDGTVTILLGNGDGTFTATAVSPATGTEPFSVAVADFKGDGKADLAVANRNDGNAGTVTILLGNGDGTFTAAAASPATGNGPKSVAVGDFNGDGIPDLAVANYNGGNAGTVTILLGNGDGTFTAAGVSPATGNGPDFVAVGDFNGGGVSDLAIANYTDNTATVLLTGNRTATATASGIAATGAGTHLVEASYPGDSNYSSGVSGTIALTGTVAAPVSFSPTSLTFSPQNVGVTSAPQTVTVTNTGTANLTFSPVTIGGTNASNFGKSVDTCSGATLTPNNTCTVSVTFTPSATGSLSASLKFTDNASTSPQTVGLTGTGTVPVPAVAPPTLTFGNQILGTTSGSQPVTLSNTGNAALTITRIATSANFGETNNCGSSVAASGSCTINVTFSPTEAGTLTGTLTITDNSNGVAASTPAVSLSGTGTSLRLSATSLSFGARLMGSGSLKTVTLTNLGSAPLSISSFSVVSFTPPSPTGTTGGDFAIVGSTCVAGGSVAGLGSCTINLAFKPTAAGIRSATLFIADSDPSSPQTVNLRGTGTAVLLSAASLNLGPERVDTSSAPKTVTLTNLGNTPLRIESLTLRGTDAGDFAIQSSSTCAAGKTLAGEGSCTINLAFKPSAAGARSATLVISDSDPGSPQTVSLSGAGM